MLWLNYQMGILTYIPMSPGAAIIASSESLFSTPPSRLAAVYQAIYHGLFWMMDDEEHHLSILNIRFWRDSSAIIWYFYNNSYLYMSLYQFYTLSTAFMFESKPARLFVNFKLRQPIRMLRWGFGLIQNLILSFLLVAWAENPNVIRTLFWIHLITPTLTMRLMPILTPTLAYTLP